MPSETNADLQLGKLLNEAKEAAEPNIDLTQEEYDRIRRENFQKAKQKLQQKFSAGKRRSKKKSKISKRKSNKKQKRKSKK